MLKSFDDFMETISEEELNQIANENAKKIAGDSNKFTPTQLSAFSFSMSISLLRKYHQWLSDQLT